jgi:hypothetical protein
MLQLRAGIIRGVNRAANAAERPTEERGGSMGVVLTAWLTTTTARARGSTPGRRRCHVCPPRTSFTIWDRCSFGREEEEEEEDDSDGLQERDNDKGTMTTTNDCSGRGRRNAKGRWNLNIVAIGRQRQWHRGTSRQLPPRLVVG